MIGEKNDFKVRGLCLEHPDSIGIRTPSDFGVVTLPKKIMV